MVDQKLSEKQWPPCRRRDGYLHSWSKKLTSGKQALSEQEHNATKLKTRAQCTNEAIRTPAQPHRRPTLVRPASSLSPEAGLERESTPRCNVKTKGKRLKLNMLLNVLRTLDLLIVPPLHGSTCPAPPPEISLGRGKSSSIAASYLHCFSKSQHEQNKHVTQRGLAQQRCFEMLLLTFTEMLALVFTHPSLSFLLSLSFYRSRSAVSFFSLCAFSHLCCLLLSLSLFLSPVTTCGGARCQGKKIIVCQTAGSFVDVDLVVAKPRKCCAKNNPCIPAPRNTSSASRHRQNCWLFAKRLQFLPHHLSTSTSPKKKEKRVTNKSARRKAITRKTEKNERQTERENKRERETLCREVTAWAKHSWLQKTVHGGVPWARVQNGPQ